MLILNELQFNKVNDEIESMENEISDLKRQCIRLEADLSHDLERIELRPLYYQIHIGNEKLKSFQKERKNKLTPDQEKEKLLKQVKNDNEM